MPELPEVETARRAVEEHCVGRRINRAVVADDTKVIDGVSVKDFESALLGKTIVGVHRKGKNMWIELDSPPFPTFQFGMAGAVHINGVAVAKYKRSGVTDTDEWPSKYSKVFIELDNGLGFSFTDKRRFAKVRLLKDPISVPPISELGPDALKEPMTLENFFNCLSKKKIGVKALLLDQGFISGIGNWMADEVLYQARIHPQQAACSIPKESCDTLLKCINEVIEKAVDVKADSSQFPSSWIFHSREKKPGKAYVDGKKIEFIKAGGRTTAYVPQLQKLTGDRPLKETGKRSRVATNGSSDAEESEEEGKPVVRKAGKRGQAKKNGLRQAAEEDERKGDAKQKPRESHEKNGKKKQTRRKAARKNEETDSDNDSNDADEEEESEAMDGEHIKPAASLKKQVTNHRKTACK